MSTPAPCPICKRPRQAAYAPFCSKRCADIDLQKWFSRRLRIPAEENQDAPEDGEPGRRRTGWTAPEGSLIAAAPQLRGGPYAWTYPWAW